jgi:2-polyprenyl-6-methoxyphenol hydroxylase-like FAD-dependent oxidoreductase
MFDTDVFIAGGGPGGIAAALAARQRDFRVTLADAGKPLDKACGEGLMPDTLTAAARLGIEIPERAQASLFVASASMALFLPCRFF